MRIEKINKTPNGKNLDVLVLVNPSELQTMREESPKLGNNLSLDTKNIILSAYDKKTELLVNVADESILPLLRSGQIKLPGLDKLYLSQPVKYRGNISIQEWEYQLIQKGEPRIYHNTKPSHFVTELRMEK